MTAKDLFRILTAKGCGKIRQKGSHVIFRCGECQTVIPMHAGDDIKAGTLRAIEKQLEPCLGRGWLTKK